MTEVYNDLFIAEGFCYMITRVKGEGDYWFKIFNNEMLIEHEVVLEDEQYLSYLKNPYEFLITMFRDINMEYIDDSEDLGEIGCFNGDILNICAKAQYLLAKSSKAVITMN